MPTQCMYSSGYGLFGSLIGTSVRSISREFGGVEYSAVEYHFRDPRIGVDRQRRILSEQQQVGAFSDLHGANVPIELQGECVCQRRRLEDLRRSLARVDESVHLQPPIETGWIGVGG